MTSDVPSESVLPFSKWIQSIAARPWHAASIIRRWNLRHALPLALSIVLLTPGNAEPVPNADQILASARLAAGALTRSRDDVLEASGRIETRGLKGRFQRDVQVSTGRFMEKSDLGIYATMTVFNGRDAFAVDPSGGVHALDGRFGRRAAATDSWLGRRAYLMPNGGGAKIQASGRRVEGGRSYDVLVALPKGGQAVELWFDTSTHLLAKDVRQGAISISTERFEDYRITEGAQLPFRISRSTDFTTNVTDIIVDAYRLTTPGDRFVAPLTRADSKLAAPTDVPVEIDNQVVIEGSLDGHGPYRFILDSGGHNIITPAVASELGLQPVGAAQSGGAGAGTVTQQDVMVRSLRFGDASLRDQHFYVIPLQYGTIEQGERPPLAGIIGLELFERLAVLIDYRRSRLTLIPSAQAAGRCGGIAIPITFDDDMPLVDGTLEGHRGVLAIDSGNSGSTAVQGKWAKANGLFEQLSKGVASTSFGAGGSSTTWITRSGHLSIGPIGIPGADLRLTNDGKGSLASTTEAANVGQQILARFTTLFDYAHSRICLQPVPGYVTPPLNRTGLATTKTDRDHFRIVSVAVGSDSANHGIRPGDLIIAVDGKPARTLSGNDIFRTFRQPVGTKVRLDVQRADVRFQSSIVLQEASN
ncbi:PDZ domain-containing protein [Sphingomonas koreensis]|nr:PDZ domain-containing protein [Sphingomonas koreensis]